jgi:hypothetical protein
MEITMRKKTATVAITVMFSLVLLLSAFIVLINTSHNQINERDVSLIQDKNW